MNGDALEKHRTAGRIAREALLYGLDLVKEGSRLLDVVEETETLIVKRGALPAFPVNISIDSVAAHFTPSHGDRMVFQRGNLVKLDVGVHIDGYVADNARTVEVGTNKWSDLIRAADEAVSTAIEVVKPGVSTRSVGAAIERTISSFGYKPISNLTGHSLKQYTLHAQKTVPNVASGSHTPVEDGDVFAIEPFSTNGVGRVDGRRSGNIYRIMRMKDMGDGGAYEMIKRVYQDFRGLPFSERWCFKIDERATIYLKKLLSTGAVMTYPILAEVGGGMVAQSEHTVIVTRVGCEVITGGSF